MASSPHAYANLGALHAAARQTLRDNDRGGYTVPSPALYPFQWNWDSAVTALGWMCFDEARAWRELERLFEGQWPNGMVPHIVFHQTADSYFPGPEQWGLSERTPPTSSISQPPLVASMVRLMEARALHKEPASRAVRALLPRLLEYHRWWLRDRDPEGLGVCASYHPWETGMDNSPAWDAALQGVPPTSRPYKRKDTGHVDPSQRPAHSDYDRYVYLMDFFKECRFDPATLFERSPFIVVDFGTNALLARACADLGFLCRQHGLSAEASEMNLAAARMRQALEGLWSPALGQYVSKDLRSGKLLEAGSAAGFLAWYAGLDGADRSLGRLRASLSSKPYGVASTHPEDPSFDPKKYWRGPVWPHINWLIARGLAESGHEPSALQIRAMTFELLLRHGFREYFHPESGEGFGGSQFSWTAAVSLFWSPDPS